MSEEQQPSILELQARWDKIRIANLYDTLDKMGYPNQCLDLGIRPLFPRQHLAGDVGLHARHLEGVGFHHHESLERGQFVVQIRVFVDQRQAGLGCGARDQGRLVEPHLTRRHRPPQHRVPVTDVQHPRDPHHRTRRTPPEVRADLGRDELTDVRGAIGTTTHPTLTTLDQLRFVHPVLITNRRDRQRLADLCGRLQHARGVIERGKRVGDAGEFDTGVGMHPF